MSHTTSTKTKDKIPAPRPKPYKAESKPNKSKLKKREFLEQITEETRPPKIVNYQDEEIHNPEAIKNGPAVYNKALFLRFGQILQSYGDLSYFLEMLRFRNGFDLIEESNGRICKLIKELKAMKDCSTTPFLSNESDRFCWFVPESEQSSIFQSNDTPLYTSFPGEQTPFPDNLDLFLGSSDRYIGRSINKLVEEEEQLGMVIKVYICESCEAGTSYCSRQVDKDAGAWICNYCKAHNNVKTNQFYLYNKIGASFGSQLFNSGTDVTGPPVSAFPQGIYFEPKFEKSEFYHDVWHKPLRCKLFGKPEKVSKSEIYGNFAIVFVNIACHEIQVDALGKCIYLFQVHLVSNAFREESLHRLMILSNIGKNMEKFRLDELLAVLFDDINHLSFEGINVAKEGGFRHYKFYLVSFLVDPLIQKEFFGRFANTSVLKPFYESSLRIVPFFRVILKYMLKPNIKKTIASNHKDTWFSNVFVPLFTINDLRGAEEYGKAVKKTFLSLSVDVWDDFQTFTFFHHLMELHYQGKVELDKYSCEILHFFHEVYILLVDLRIFSPNQAITNDDIFDQLHNISHRFLSIDPRSEDTDGSVKYCISILHRLQSVMFHHGELKDLCEFRVLPTEVDILRRRLTWKRAKRITNTLGKTDVVLSNYMSSFFRLFKILVADSKPLGSSSTTFVTKIEALINDLALSGEEDVLEKLLKEFA
ncbi:hypothetical protein WICPIJ_000113 [Wickerhamomyces pijperi]|uniref:Uncharacterized protein n=1 Tax=Wickerhamomyces pijperi TaxID=599730 RepID=A0A9P8TS90_WICPI|nr:hypothetical protein WICPIJ_000113 [Wickerhamomyces pijperi]